MNTFVTFSVSSSLPERGEGHDSQDEPAEDQFCDPQQRPLDWPSVLQPYGRQPDLQGDEEDGEEDLKMLTVIFFFEVCPDPLLCSAAVMAVTVVRVPQPGVSLPSVSHQPSFADEANALLIPIILWSVALISSGDGPSWHTPPLTPLLWEALQEHSGRQQQHVGGHDEASSTTHRGSTAACWAGGREKSLVLWTSASPGWIRLFRKSLKCDVTISRFINLRIVALSEWLTRWMGAPTPGTHTHTHTHTHSHIISPPTALSQSATGNTVRRPGPRSTLLNKFCNDEAIVIWPSCHLVESKV